MEIMVLKRQGLSRRKIAQRLGIHRRTVDRYLARGGERKAYDTRFRQSCLVPYQERILAWMEEDAYSAVWM